MALPLIHHLLDTDIGQELGESVAGRKHERLGNMIAALRTLSSKYDGVEWVSNLLKQSLQQNDLLPDAAHQASPPQPQQLRKDNNTISYLRVAFTVEVSLSRSKFARQKDLPRCLASLFKENIPISAQHETNQTLSRPQDIARDSNAFASPEYLHAEWDEFFVLDRRSGTQAPSSNDDPSS